MTWRPKSVYEGREVVTLKSQYEHRTRVMYFRKDGFDGSYEHRMAEHHWSRLGQILYVRGVRYCGFSSANVKR